MGLIFKREILKQHLWLHNTSELLIGKLIYLFNIINIFPINNRKKVNEQIKTWDKRDNTIYKPIKALIRPKMWLVRSYWQTALQKVFFDLFFFIFQMTFIDLSLSSLNILSSPSSNILLQTFAFSVSNFSFSSFLVSI